MSVFETSQPSKKLLLFLSSISPGRYDRQTTVGISKFIENSVYPEMQGFYTADELSALAELQETEQDVGQRMPVKITRHYFEQAKFSRPLQQLIKASPNETVDMAGSPDPGKQMHYSPIEGLIHKYEIGLIYVAATCSAHCRFCYREELISGKDITHPDGTVQPKGLAQVDKVCKYIRQHNQIVANNNGKHPASGRGRLREILLSGGDPMVLGNKKLANWMGSLSEAGIDSIRIGTKELAFFPDRFDDSFFDMLDKFHASYPQTNLRFIVHFNHPDEFLKKDRDGNFIQHQGGGLVWLDKTLHSVQRLASRHWINIDNQSPIIRDINNDPQALRIMQRELKRNRIENHYFFCGRDIVGYRAFNVPIESAWHILKESQTGLSGIESHARLVASHFLGKIEIVSITSKPLPIPGAEEGAVILKLLRCPADNPQQGRIAIVGRNPDALWFDDYEDRVLFDEIGLFAETGNQ